MNQAKPLTPKIVLAIAAHPDDIDFGASGTVSRFVEQGAKAYYLILTDGSKGSADPHISGTELIKLRQAEQRAAGKVIGLTDVFFLDHPDGGLVNTMELKREIVRVIRTVKPEVVITMDPSVLYVAEIGFINHPDHRAAGQAVLDSVFPLARDHLSFPELYTDENLAGHKTKHALLINMAQGNYWTDVSGMVDKKVAILQAHVSQVPDTTEGVTAFVRRIGGHAAKDQPYELAEQFIRIDIPE